MDLDLSTQDPKAISIPDVFPVTLHGSVLMAACSSCGRPFWAPRRPNGGRPRTKCDRCRTNHDKIDGVRWRAIRAQVLLEEPVCRICGLPSSEADHIVPLKFGGDPFARENLQGACKHCNSSKGARVARQTDQAPRRWEL